MYVYRWISLGSLILLSAVFSGTETALTALSGIKARHLRQKLGEKGNIFDIWLKNPERLLITILIGNNFVNIAASAIATSLAITAAQERGFSNSHAVGIATGIMTFTILVFGEIAPKTFAHANAKKIAPAGLRFMYVLSLLLYPIVVLLSWISSGVTALFGGKARNVKPFIMFEEIRLAISAGEQEGILKENEKEMIESVFEFGQTAVSAIMTPRTDVFAVESNTLLDNALDSINKSGYSRIPVYTRNIDNITGILYAKDLLEISADEDKDTIRLNSLVKKPIFIPETMRIDNLLKKFKEVKTHVAIVVDEYGGTAGLVTLEDVLEEIVGEIEDEYDPEGILWKRLESGSFLVDSRLEIEKANEELGLDIERSGFDTVGGAVLAFAGRLPKTGEVFSWGNLKIKITDADERRIKQLKIDTIKDVQEKKEREQLPDE